MFCADKRTLAGELGQTRIRAKLTKEYSPHWSGSIPELNNVSVQFHAKQSYPLPLEIHGQPASGPTS
jgi:hypothetical protein